MRDWEMKPARDLGLTGLARSRSLERESGLVESVARLVWWTGVWTSMKMLHRLQVRGVEHLPAQPPLLLAANHASHLDALVIGCALPVRWRDRVAPIAASDVFFENAALAGFVTTMMNAFPILRKKGAKHGLDLLRRRLVDEGLVYILFPEGTRTRTGTMNPFRSGVGRLVAGTDVPVVPCYLEGTYEAFPPGRILPNLKRIALTFGPARRFADVANERDGWDQVAATLEADVHGLGEVCRHAKPG